jgi:hypothetical protein
MHAFFDCFEAWKISRNNSKYKINRQKAILHKVVTTIKAGQMSLNSTDPYVHSDPGLTCHVIFFFDLFRMHGRTHLG